MIPFTKSYRIICPVVLVLLLSFSTAPVWGEESVVEYVRDVKPIFKAHCYSCHGISSTIFRRLLFKLIPSSVGKLRLGYSV